MKTKYNENTLTVAKQQIKNLMRDYNLNPVVLEYFEQGELCYSYITGGIIGSVDTLSYDPAYEKAVVDFENKYDDCLVYHVIETQTSFGMLLSLLYVKVTWSANKAHVDKKGYTRAYVVNLDVEECSEFGMVRIARNGNFGSLVRIE